MFFTQDALNRFQLSKSDLELLTEREKGEKEKEKEKEKEAKEAKEAKDSKDGKDSKDAKDSKESKDAKDKKKEEPIKVEIAGLEDRLVRLTVHSSELADAVLTPDGEKLLYLAEFEKGHDLWLQKPREKETKLLAKLGAEAGRLHLDKDGKNVFVLAGGRVTKIEIDSGKQEGVGFSGEMRLNRQLEREHLFEHVWRQTAAKFYVADLHGVDWKFYKQA